MTCRSYHKRPTPIIDEHIYQHAISRYTRLHPCIAAILAYEDATGTGQGAVNTRDEQEEQVAA